ncbi:MAG: ExeM/NucH family extracellular endonuclease [Halomonadaceae bacterium]|nr:MAG: ExeM/NucH family extracellular endonuclease [Halomonadaceae bacterium]
MQQESTQHRWRQRGKAWLPVAAGSLAGVYFALAAWLNPLEVAADAPCGEPGVLLSALQGEVSPRTGDWVTVEAVVSADFTHEDGFGGFFLQQPAAEVAPDKTRSRGLFVYAPETQVVVGERLRLRGQVGQHHGMTQLSRIQIEGRCGEHGALTPVPVSLPLTEAQRHRLQGMVITLEPPITVTGNYSLGRFGTLKLADERLYIPTQLALPGQAAQRLAAANRERMLILDNGSRRQFPDPVPYPPEGLTAERTVRTGDQLEALTGVLDYRYDNWRLQPLSTPLFNTANPRPQAPPAPEAGQLRLAAFNVENYFNGNQGFPTPRGAISPRELARQEAKLSAVLRGLQAAAVGLVEVANDGYGADSSIASLAAMAGEDWAWATPETPRTGSDEITNGLIYDRRQLVALGPAFSPEHRAFMGGNRPPLGQWLRHRHSGVTVLVVVNHWKSKRCGNATGEQQDQNDGQACWNPLRLAAAEALIQWLGTLPEAAHSPVLLLGDLNAYAREEPLQRLAAAGFTNLLAEQQPPPHSYVFMGQSGTLDYALGNPPLLALLEQVQLWGINGDEPPLLDYRLGGKTREQRQQLFSDSPWRSSDHDPIWVDIRPN